MFHLNMLEPMKMVASVRRLREERGLTFLMVSHDLAVIDHMCDRIMVMQHGRTVEEMSRDDLANARMTTEYARSLFDASADRMLGDAGGAA